MAGPQLGAKTEQGADGTAKAPSALAGFTRALLGTLAFIFKRPIRLFRPVKSPSPDVVARVVADRCL